MSKTHDDDNENNHSDPFVLHDGPATPYPACIQRPHAGWHAAGRPRPCSVPPRYDPGIEPRLIPHVMGMIARAEVRLGRLRLRPFTLIPLSADRVEQLKEEEWSE